MSGTFLKSSDRDHTYRDYLRTQQDPSFDREGFFLPYNYSATSLNILI